jgi:hypothetical protein
MSQLGPDDKLTVIVGVGVNVASGVFSGVEVLVGVGVEELDDVGV